MQFVQPTSLELSEGLSYSLGELNNTTMTMSDTSLLSSTEPPKMTTQELAEYTKNFDFPFCNDVSKYEKISKIGQGTFGEVFKAKHKKSKKNVALKKFLTENGKEGFPITALREVRILRLLKHENVVNLIEICRTKPTTTTTTTTTTTGGGGQNIYSSTFYIVMDLCDHDLAGLLSNCKVKFSLGEIKKVMQQLLNGLYYIHANKILHRDMKTANVLLTNQGILKLADFGLARPISVNPIKKIRYTNRVVTLWYRAPELLLGDRHYGPAIDMWGAGCIMAEMWTRTAVMQGSTEQQQITLISQLCGSITREVWPTVDTLELYQKMVLPTAQKRKVKDRMKFYAQDPFACDLIDRLLTLDPSKRINADSALNHDFFWTDPMPRDLSEMLHHHRHNNMFEYSSARRRGVVANPLGGAAQPPTQNQQQQQQHQQQRKDDAGYRDRVF